MNSNHVRIGAFLALLVTGLLAAGDITKVLPFLKPQYATLVVIVLVAVKEYLLSVTTPATNSATPDNLPPKAP